MPEQVWFLRRGQLLSYTKMADAAGRVWAEQGSPPGPADEVLDSDGVTEFFVGLARAEREAWEAKQVEAAAKHQERVDAYAEQLATLTGGGLSEEAARIVLGAEPQKFTPAEFTRDKRLVQDNLRRYGLDDQQIQRVLWA